jgi:hypothetical protein
MPYQTLHSFIDDSDRYRRQLTSPVELYAEERTLWYCERVGVDDGDDSPIKDGEYTEGDNDRRRCNGNEANLVSSLLSDGRHAPVLDIDFDARLVPSRTKGHHHLYLEKPMSWFRYRVLLWALKFCGVVEPGYYRASVQRRMTFCRWRPWGEAATWGAEEYQVAQVHALRDKIRSM